MSKKRMITVGIIGVLVGLILLFAFGGKLAEANDFLEMGNKYNLGNTHMNAWSGNADNAKVGIGIGAVVLLVFGCLLIGGCCMEKKPENRQNATERLKKLEEAKEESLISKEEYEKKRAEILEDF